VFLELLQRFGVEVLADVRSHPYSQYVPHYNRESLQESIAASGRTYLFLGKELGGRPEDPESYDADGHVRYDRVAESKIFLDGIRRVQKSREKSNVALMCSEENPAVCHRHLLIGRVLAERGVSILHIRADGRLQTDDEVRKTGGKDIEVYQPTLFGDELPWRSLRPILRNRQEEEDG
jgi:uncharacterized protein (DUF488 family)